MKRKYKEISSSESNDDSGSDDESSSDDSDEEEEEEEPVADECVDARYQPDERIMIAGGSNSGKTTLLLRLLANQERYFRKPIRKILWYHGKGTRQPIHDELEQVEDAHVRIKEGLPKDLEQEIGETGCPADETWLIVFDDLMDECAKNDTLKNAVTKVSHHKNCTVIYLTQNAYNKGKHSVTNSRNMSEVIFMIEGRTRKPIKGFLSEAGYDATQIKDVVKWMDDNTKGKIYQNIAINYGMKHDHRCRIRINICPDEEKEEFTLVYQP